MNPVHAMLARRVPVSDLPNCPEVSLLCFVPGLLNEKTLRVESYVAPLIAKLFPPPLTSVHVLPEPEYDWLREASISIKAPEVIPR